MVESRGHRAAGALLAAALLLAPAAALARQNQSPPRPPTPGQPAAGNQSPAAPGNASAAAPQSPPAIPLYISPGIVQQIQQKLLSLNLPVPTVSGAWGDNSSAGLRTFQTKNGIDPGGDLDELTLQALGLLDVLRGDAPAGAAAATAQGVAAGGAPLHASARLTRLVQAKLTEAGFPTDNVFGIWLAGSETAARNFQKAKGLDITGSVDLRLLHELGLSGALLEPKTGKLPTDLPAQVLSEKALTMTGAPISIGPAGVRQIQAALQQRGFKDVRVDGRWSDTASAALKKFQESQQLEPTGSVNLRTLRALGFNNPLLDLDKPSPASPKTQ
jgi:peptidoglycan hydrolase-like protein with peptidoglycan-binding domain